MATASLSTLIDRTRRYMRDWPQQDQLSASVTSGGTSLTVADSTLYYVNQPIEIDGETMLVRALPDSTHATVFRGAFNSVAASHASSATVTIRPRFWQIEIQDAINYALNATYPYIYKEVVDESITTASAIYQYTLPNMPGTYDGATLPIQWVARLYLKETGDLTFRKLSTRWWIERGATPKITFKRDQAPGTLRVRGFGPFPALLALTDTLDAQFPTRAERFIIEFAASYLLASGENLRVRADTGAIDNREMATKPGVSAAQSQQLFARFYTMLKQLAMPPLAGTAQPAF